MIDELAVDRGTVPRADRSVGHGVVRRRLDGSLPRDHAGGGASGFDRRGRGGGAASCARHGAAVVPQGGNTGLVAGGVPLAGEIVLSLRRLDTIDRASVDPVAGQLTAGAGRRIADVQAAARDGRLGLRRRLGGAGHGDGRRLDRDERRRRARVALRRHPCASCSASRPCSPTDRSSRISAGSVKDNTGYHLPVAGVRQRGHARRRDGGTAARSSLVATSASSRCSVSRRSTTRCSACASLRRSLPSLEAAELFFADGVALVREQLALPRPARRGATCTCSSSARITSIRAPALAAAVDEIERRRRCRRRRSGAAGGIVALPRGPHRGHQHDRSAAQARRDAATSATRRLRPRGAHRGRGRRAVVARVAVRSRGRRQPPRQRHRRRSPATTASTTPSCVSSSIAAAASPPSTASARPRSAGCHSTGATPSSARCAPSRRRSTPRDPQSERVVLNDFAMRMAGRRGKRQRRADTPRRRRARRAPGAERSSQLAELCLLDLARAALGERVRKTAWIPAT